MYHIIYSLTCCLHNLAEEFSKKDEVFSKRLSTLNEDKDVEYLGVRNPEGDVELKKGCPKKCPFLPEGQGPFAPIK